MSCKNILSNVVLFRLCSIRAIIAFLKFMTRRKEKRRRINISTYLPLLWSNWLWKAKMKRRESKVLLMNDDAILWQFILLLSKSGRFILITGQEGGQGVEEGRLEIWKQEFRKYYYYYPEKQKKKKDIVTRTYLTTNCIFTE